jgi:hypothetical protein
VQERNNQEGPLQRGESAGRSSRRKLLKASAVLVPAMVTLHARSAFGQGGTLNPNYVSKAYPYGTLSGSGLDTFGAAAQSVGGGGAWVNANGDPIDVYAAYQSGQRSFIYRVPRSGDPPYVDHFFHFP